MSIFSRFRRFIDRDGRDPRPDYVSPSVLLYHERHASTRGVDLPRWKTPREVAQIRRQERRAALRVVNGRGAERNRFSA